jgi:methylenetetrahydrofolate dehydrogenase (NADP+)/methenyltetrahydrofolate cyclohydrolase
LPLPSHLNKLRILNSIKPEKDVDGFTFSSLGKLMQEKEELVAATPKGCIKLLEAKKVKFQGKHAVIVGHSIIVGKPLAMLLLNRNATVTVCHKFTKNLSNFTRKADLLFVAVGKPKLIKASMVKKNAIIIDIGINKVKGKICGDIDFEKIKNKAKLITPVPGGIGPMTVAMLLENTVIAAEKTIKK